MVFAIDIKVLTTRGLVTGQGGFWKKRLKMLAERYLTLVRKWKRLITTQKLQRLEKRPIAIGLATTAHLNTKSIETENKLPDIINLATTAAPNTKLIELKGKYVTLLIWQMLKLFAIKKVKTLKIKYATISFITTPEFKRLIRISFGLEIKEEAINFASKKEIKDLIYLGDKNQGKTENF